MKWFKVGLSALVWSLIAFAAGAFIGGQTVEPASGLAGGATVFMWGLGLGFLGLIAGGLTQLHGGKAIRKVGLILGLALLLPIALFFAWKLNAEQPETPLPPKVKPVTTEAISPEETSRIVRDTDLHQAHREAQSTEVNGLGFVDFPINYGRSVLYFYAEHDASVATDSLLLSGESLLYAPPYLLPFYQKLDYGQLTFRWLATARNRYQLALNAGDNRRAWVNRDAVVARNWPEFLLNVFAVKALDSEGNPLRIKPFDYGSIISNLPQETYFLQPIQVTDEWIQLAITNDAGQAMDKMGWMRWRRGEALLISWDYRL